MSERGTKQRGKAPEKGKTGPGGDFPVNNYSKGSISERWDALASGVEDLNREVLCKFIPGRLTLIHYMVDPH